MPGKQAKILSKDNCGDLLVFASTTRHPAAQPADRTVVGQGRAAGGRDRESDLGDGAHPDRRHRTRNRTARPGGQEIGRAADPDPS